MSIVSNSRRLLSLGWSDRWLLVEAASVVTAASIAIRLLPFRLICKIAEREVNSRGGASEEIARVRWAVEAVSRRLPWKTVCFQKGLAVHTMLRSRGVETILHYGIRQEAGRDLAAHVWVTAGGTAIIGGEEAKGFTCLATYPLLRPRVDNAS